MYILCKPKTIFNPFIDECFESDVIDTDTGVRVHKLFKKDVATGIFNIKIDNNILFFSQASNSNPSVDERYGALLYFNKRDNQFYNQNNINVTSACIDNLIIPYEGYNYIFKKNDDSLIRVSLERAHKVIAQTKYCYGILTTKNAIPIYVLAGCESGKIILVNDKYELREEIKNFMVLLHLASIDDIALYLYL